MFAVKPNKWAVLSVITFVSFISNLDATIVVIGLQPIVKDLQIPIATGMWTITAFFITNTVFLLPSGRWSDMFGTKKIFLWGFGLFTFATVLCGLANSGSSLIAARLLQGVGAAMAMATTTPILMRTFPSSQLGFALGINNISWVTGSLIGPVLGGALVGEFGWRSIFFVIVPFGIISLIAAVFVLESSRTGEREKTDWLGIMTFGSGLVAFLVALSEGTALGWASAGTIGLFAATLIFWSLFGYIERKVQYPLFHLSLLRNQRYTIGLGITMSYCIGYFSVTILLTLYLQGAQHLSSLETGLLLIPLSVPQLFTGPIGGKLADRFGTVNMILLGSFLIGVSLLLLGQLGTQLSNMAVIVPLLIISAATGLSWPSLAKAVLSAAPLEQAGSASGMFGTIYNMCRAMSQALVLLVVQLGSTSINVTKMFSEPGAILDANSKSVFIKSTNMGFRFFALFLAISLVLGLFLMRIQQKQLLVHEIQNAKQSG
ncbi:MFS transporter [Shimazuella sp. AN120528]|uniref:MFS transporter n=1 Tax=Shimazuella soli TaxID=1892854 RepID=UPI001F0CF1AE|nr:MFS transporter [Shimazuella soli]MCH5586080.1 MFS transporter [Shimazuella soli]